MFALTSSLEPLATCTVVDRHPPPVNVAINVGSCRAVVSRVPQRISLTLFKEQPMYLTTYVGNDLRVVCRRVVDQELEHDDAVLGW